ncbi:hypothetical protein ACS3UN_01205 [Oscillospiraceae bacterium LTW-04]|nr:FliH/SctL family protein [Oscillospiraceae bacterium MB24-C1]
MRRIYKPNNVTTSEKYFLLGDTGEHTSAEGIDADVFLDHSEEGEASTHTPINQSDDLAEKTLDDENKPTTKRHTPRSTVQDIAQLEQLRDQIIAQATAESARLIEEGHAKAQAEYQAAIARASEQIERDRQAACIEGQQQALEQTTKDITNCIRNIEQTLAHLESAQAGFITGYEQDLKWMALEIAQKILMDKITADDTQLVPLVMNAVNSVSNSPWMSVEISEHMTGLLTQLQQKLQDNPVGSKVNIRLIDAPPDTCIVETPDKFFDASIRQQIENLKGYFAAEQG